MTVAGTLASFLTTVSTADLPPQTIMHAEMLIASTLASAAWGTGITSAQIIRDLVREQGGTPEASIWFDAGPKVPVTQATRVNAMLSDAAASDDSDLRNIVHTGTTLVSTAFALAERTGASGQDILTAMVLGYEAAGRIGDAVTPGLRQRGFHGCIVAAFGGTVTAGRLLGLDATALTHAIALTATSMGGLAAAANTSVAREYHAGLAAMLGLQAAMAAQRGYTAEPGILELPHGFCQAYGGTDGASITRDLGQSWDIITDMAIKLVPGGHPHHSLGEAAAKAARAGNIAPHEVASIILSRPGVTALDGPHAPKDLIDMAHSPAYFLAAGVADHEFSWAHAMPAKINDPVIHQLLDKVRVGPQPTEHVAQYRQGATVTIETTDGRRVSATVLVPKGAGVLGIAWADVDAKYRRLLADAPVSTAQVEASLRVIHVFRQVPHVSALLETLRVAAS